MYFIPFTWIYYSEISCPKVKPAPLGLTLKPTLSSGSLHKRSHIGPSWGTSYILSSYLILSKVSRLGDSPPWRENIFPSTSAVSGR